MAVVAVSSFWLHYIKLWGIWSLIHLLSISTLTALPFAVLAAHRHDVRRHQRAVIALFAGALLIAGIFTFAHGRIMHAVVFGD